MSRTAADSLLLLHLVAAIVWIGPALGAWWYVLRNQLWQDQDKRERDALDDWILNEFIRVAALEHVAFVVLIVSGILRAHANGWTDGGVIGPAAPTWLNLKLVTIALVVIPFEMFDVWVAHWLLPARLARRSEDPEAYAAALKKHDLVVWAGSAVLGVAIPIILYAVTFRPA